MTALLHDNLKIDCRPKCVLRLHSTRIYSDKGRWLENLVQALSSSAFPQKAKQAQQCFDPLRCRGAVSEHPPTLPLATIRGARRMPLHRTQAAGGRCYLDS